MGKLSSEELEKIKSLAEGYKADMTAFLRAIVANPGESSDEAAHVATIKAEMEKVGFDEVKVDPQGNVMGFMGTGKTLIAFDGHIDTVGIGNRDNWNFDPYEGFEDEEEIGGRGVSDQLGGTVSAVYAAKIMKDLGLLNDKYRVMVVGTVQEEDCDGLCWEYIYHEDKIRPEFVVSSEPTDGGLYRGQRGRMEIRIDVKGVSCHGSAPDRGDNAIYKMADILRDVRALNNNGDAESTEVRGLVKMLNPSIQVIGVEPENAACMKASIKEDHIVTLESANTIADGTAVKTPGDKLFKYIKENIHDIITINDNELIVSFLDMVENHKMVVENSGLLTVAALKHLNVKGKKIVSILSGGNMDVITMASLIQHGLIERGRIFTVSVLLPDKPGELAKVADLLASERGNVVKLEHNQFISINRNAAVELRITIEAYGTEHKKEIVERLNKEGYRPKLVRSKGTYNA